MCNPHPLRYFDIFERHTFAPDGILGKDTLANWYGARLQRNVTQCNAEENSNSPPTGARA
jgi:hypothetical protein